MFYKALFNINIHHGYFLDSGEEKFLPVNNSDDEMSDEDKETALENFKFSDYIRVIPTKATQQHFKNYRIIMRAHSQGFRVLISTLETDVSGDTKYVPIITPQDELTFTFELQATDPYFYNYTQFSNAYKDEEQFRIHLFTNIEPSGQANSFENLFENDGGVVDNSFLARGAASRELIRSIAEEDVAFLTTNDQFSITNSIRLIEADESLTSGEKDDQIEALLNGVIASRKKKKIVGYIRLTIKGNHLDGDYDLLEIDNEDRYALEETPDFTISFKNQKSFWRYISLSDDATLTTKNKKWLSRNGFIEITNSDFNNAGLDLPPGGSPDDYTFPNPTVDMIKEEGGDFYSEIFI
ncbi:MAG: hypothetical protein HRT68_07310 [Flavobacteriaceae bacterium]|nr:hypothetical protein [Flavobacteriaceae bacterium]